MHDPLSQCNPQCPDWPCHRGWESAPLIRILRGAHIGRDAWLLQLRQAFIRAWSRARRKQRLHRPGADGLSFCQFCQTSVTETACLSEQLSEGAYERGGLIRWRRRKPNGDRRDIWVATVRDRVVARALLDILQPHVEPSFNDASVGGRPGRGPQQAVARVLEAIRSGRVFMARTDIERFFDSIPRDVAHDRLQEHIGNESLCDLACLLTRHPLSSHVGIAQGSALSTFVANVYMNRVDAWFTGRRLHYVRYIDDIAVLSGSQHSANRAFRYLETRLADQQLRLSPRPDKTYVRTTNGPEYPEFLGFEFSHGGARVPQTALDALASEISDLEGSTLEAEVVRDNARRLMSRAAYFAIVGDGRLEALLRRACRLAFPEQP